MTEKNRMRLALATGYALRTVARWAKGGHVSDTTNQELLKAASELGIVRENEVVDGKAK